MDVARVAYRLLRERPRQSLAPYAAVMVPLSVATAVVSTALYLTVFRNEKYPPGFNEVDAVLFVTLCVFAVSFVFSSVGHGAAIVGTTAAYRGQPKRIAEILDPAFTRLGALLSIAIILGALLFGLAITLVGLPIAAFLGVRLSLAVQVMMLEERSPLGAIGETWRLTSGHALRLLGLLGLLILVALPLALLLSVVPAAWEGEGRTARILLDGMTDLAIGLASIPLGAYFGAATTVYYLKLREAKR